MRQALLQSSRRQLERLIHRVRSDAEALVEQSRTGSGGKSGSELSNAPLHLGDMGTEEFLHDLNTTLLANEQYIVSEAREALRRIDDGTFGRCESCGRVISEARLEAIPYARVCVRCAAAEDATPQVNLNEGRPRSPADTLAPEGEMEEDHPKRVDPMEATGRRMNHGDVHAAGTAGGGTAVGGLAGSNDGDGDPHVAQLDEATANGRFDVEDDRTDRRTPLAGPTGGAVGGTPARKRSV
jgi:RNA polymerase-binding transcription factor DksA